MSAISTPSGSELQPSGSQLVLSIVAKDGRRTASPLTGARAIIGRAPESDIRLDHDSVSRRHAELSRDPFGRWWLRDLGSRNGTKVDGRAITERVIRTGQTFRVGQFELTLREPSVAPLDESQESTTDNIKNSGARVVDGGDVACASLHDLEPPRLEAAHLSSLLNLGQALGAEPDALARIKLLCAAFTKKEFGGEHASVLRIERGRVDAPRVLASASAETIKNGTLYISRGLLAHVLATGQPTLGSNAPSEDERVDVVISVSPDKLRIAAIACPVGADDTNNDVLYVGIQPPSATAAWLALAELMVKQYQQSEDIWFGRRQTEKHALIEQDLDRARRVQETLVPQRVSTPGLHVGIRFEPCRWVGGDYVDAKTLSDGRVFFAVADVSGKGLPAAMISSSVHAVVRSGLRSGLALADVVAGLNAFLCDASAEGSFVTMIALVLDPKTGEFECVNAGHPPAFILSPDSRCETLSVGANYPLGIDPSPLAVARAALGPNQMLALYSDGLNEMTNDAGKMLGIEGLAELMNQTFAQCHTAPIELFVNRLGKALDHFRGDRQPGDDRSLLVIRRA